MKKSRRGFIGLWGIVALLVIIVIGMTGFYIWHHFHAKVKQVAKASESPAAVSPLAKVALESSWQLETDMRNWGTSNNFLQYGFSFRLPILGWRMSSETASNGYSSLAWIAEDPGYGMSTAGARFAISMYIVGDPAAAKAYFGTISPSNGVTLGTLKNGIKLWQSNKTLYNRSFCDGGKYNHILQLSAESDQGLYIALPNGKYMSYIASFCQGLYGQNLNASYDQQSNSQEMLIAARILASIEYRSKWVPLPN